MRLSEPGFLDLRWGEAHVEVRTTAGQVAGPLALLFAPFVVDCQPPADPGTPPWTATIDGEPCIDEATSLVDAVFAVEDAIAQRLFHRSGHLLLHAGAVHRDDHTIFILGPSGSGKTTTTLELVRRGYRFMAEEYTAVGTSGTTLHPFPRGFVLKDDVLPLPPGERLELEDRTLFCPAATASLEPHPLARLSMIFPHHGVDAAPAARRLTSAELCQQLLHTTFAFEGEEDRLWPALGSLTVRGDGCSLDYRDIQDDLDLALEVLGPA